MGKNKLYVHSVSNFMGKSNFIFIIVKVPQIMKIWANESAQGVNFLSVLTDLYAISAATSYSFVRSFPFR